jgi:hypothetical protein
MLKILEYKAAVEVVNDMLEGKSQILPLKHDRYELFILNGHNILDCIDYDKAEIQKDELGYFVRFC